MTYRLVLLMVFTMPWEDVASLPGAGSVSRLIGLMVGVSWVVSVVNSGQVRAPQAPHLFAVLFVLWNASTLMWTADGPTTQERVFTYAQDLALMVIVWDTVTTFPRVRQTLLAYLAGCTVTAVSLVINFMAGDEEYHGRATLGTFNPNDVSLILALGLPVAGYMIMSAGRGRWHRLPLALGLLYIPLSGFAILVTGSRTALAALLPGFVYLGYRLARRRPGLAIASLGGLVLLCILAYPLAPPAVRLHLAGTESEIASGDLNERAGIWAEAFRLIHDHPLLGIGAGAFREAAVGANKVGHNFVLSLLSEVGVVGFGLFLAVLVTALLSLRHLAPLLREMWLALFSAWLLAALLHNWEYRKQTWLFLGLVIACGAVAGTRQAGPSAHAPRGSPQVHELPELGRTVLEKGPTLGVEQRRRTSTIRLMGVFVTSALLAVASVELGRSQGGEARAGEYPGTTTITFPKCPATVLTRRGDQAKELRRDNPGGTWDLRQAVWSGFDYPVRSDSWARGCAKGFDVHGPVPRAATRDEWYDGIGGQREGGEGLRITMVGAASSWLSARNTFIEDIEDAYDPNAGGNDARTYLNHVRAEYIRDDCIENEQPVHNMYINNSLFDGCFTAFAERPSGSDSARRGRTPADFVLENSLVYVEPQPLGPEYCDKESVELGRCTPKGDSWLGAYGIWKWSDEAAANVEVRHTIFRLDMPSYSSCQAQKWPPGSYHDVTLVWTGKGRYRRAGGCRNTVPQGVTVTKDESVWDQALTAWRSQ